MKLKIECEKCGKLTNRYTITADGKVVCDDGCTKAPKLHLRKQLQKLKERWPNE